MLRNGTEQEMTAIAAKRCRPEKTGHGMKLLMCPITARIGVSNSFDVGQGGLKLGAS
jgi:hypothetical protein